MYLLQYYPQLDGIKNFKINYLIYKHDKLFIQNNINHEWVDYGKIITSTDHHSKKIIQCKDKMLTINLSDYTIELNLQWVKLIETFNSMETIF